MAKFKRLPILLCMLVGILISNIAYGMEQNSHIVSTTKKEQVLQTMKIERGDEIESRWVCNPYIIGLVDYKKGDDSHYKESCVIDTFPALTACALISVTFFCCGCPK